MGSSFEILGKSFWVTDNLQMMIGWAFHSFYSLVTFPVTKGPRWQTGFTVNTAFICCYWTLFMVGQLLWRRESRAKKFDITNDQEVLKEVEVAHAEVGEKAPRTI